MNRDRIIWFGRYEGWLRHLAQGVKSNDEQCVRKAAALFDLMLPDECVVIPMPSHHGHATNMLNVANRMGSGHFVLDCLRCSPHESSYEQKKDGGFPDYVPMLFDLNGMADVPANAMRGGIYIIDNVICTGMTARAALDAADRATVHATLCAISYSTWR